MVELDFYLNQTRLASTNHSPQPVTYCRFIYFRNFGVLKKLKRLADASTNSNELLNKKFSEKEHLRLILSVTSDANEQYYLLRFFYKCLQVIDTTKRKYSKKHEDLIVELRKQGKSIKEIKSTTKVKSNAFICNVLKKHKLSKTVKKKKLTFAEKEKIMELWEQGESISGIARELNRPVSTIYYAFRRLGIK